MDLKTMEWIVDGLRRELESLQSEVKELKAKLNNIGTSPQKHEVQEDKLIDTKEVKKMLRVCYNPLKKTIDRLLQPICTSPLAVPQYNATASHYYSPEKILKLENRLLTKF